MIPRTRAAIQVGFERGWHVGVQLAAWLGGEPVISIADGISRADVAMTTESLVPWFSCTKLVTAVAVMQLCERGQLDLDQTVASIIPEFAANGKHTITVRHALTHTGGFRRPAGSTEMFVSGIEPSVLLEAVYAAPLEEGWVPGQRAGYHPVTGFHALGEVARRVDGRAFDALVSEEIFEPLGMADSWLALTADRAHAYGERLAVMHDTTGPTPRPIERFLSEDGWGWVQPSSSGVGPMTDLVRLAEALRCGGELDGERILSSESVEALRARHRTNMRDETFGAVIDWGLGAMVNSWHYRQKPAPYGYGDHAGRDAFGHGGMQSSLVFADPQNGLSVAFAANGMAGEPNNHRRTQPVISALYNDLGLVPAA